MDKPIKNKLVAEKKASAGPVIVCANWYQFAPGERLVQSCVESRMLLWCTQGSGRIRVNSVDEPLTSGMWRLLPWQRHIIYEAELGNPFMLGGIHFIPEHDYSHRVTFAVAHKKSDPLSMQHFRRDWKCSVIDKLFSSTFEKTNRLQLLVQYIVERFQTAPHDETIMRNLAELLVKELAESAITPRINLPPIPGNLRRIQEFVHAHIGNRVKVENLAQIINQSIPTVHRLFREYLNSTPKQWITEIRIVKAKRLLQETDLSVTAIGEQIGMPDLFHFSRVFKSQVGLSPRGYRKSRRLL
jgi:AraC-like DNA-binding protein